MATQVQFQPTVLWHQKFLQSGPELMHKRKQRLGTVLEIAKTASQPARAVVCFEVPDLQPLLAYAAWTRRRGHPDEVPVMILPWTPLEEEATPHKLTPEPARGISSRWADQSSFGLKHECLAMAPMMLAQFEELEVEPASNSRSSQQVKTQSTKEGL